MIDLLLSDGVVGGCIGAGLTWIAQASITRNERKRRALYLSIRSVIALDAFVSSCASAMTSDPEPEPGQDPDNYFDLPDQPMLPDDVDWTSISHDIAYRTLIIPQRDAEAKEAVKCICGVADGLAAKETRDEYYIPLGLEAANIAGELRTKFSLTGRETGRWDPVAELKKLETDLHRKGAEQNEGLLPNE